MIFAFQLTAIKDDSSRIFYRIYSFGDSRLALHYFSKLRRGISSFHIEIYFIDCVKMTGYGPRLKSSHASEPLGDFYTDWIFGESVTIILASFLARRYFHYRRWLSRDSLIRHDGTWQHGSTPPLLSFISARSRYQLALSPMTAPHHLPLWKVTLRLELLAEISRLRIHVFTAAHSPSSYFLWLVICASFDWSAGCTYSHAFYFILWYIDTRIIFAIYAIQGKIFDIAHISVASGDFSKECQK